jgi:hypothetical protein
MIVYSLQGHHRVPVAADFCWSATHWHLFFQCKITFHFNLGTPLRTPVTVSSTFCSLSTVLPESCCLSRLNSSKSAMAKRSEYGRCPTWMPRWPALLSVPVCKWNDHAVDKGCRCERCTLWQQDYQGKSLLVEENRQLLLSDAISRQFLPNGHP